MFISIGWRPVTAKDSVFLESRVRLHPTHIAHRVEGEKMHAAFILIRSEGRLRKGSEKRTKGVVFLEQEAGKGMAQRGRG